MVFELFGVPSQVLFGQLMIGLINGSFYALLSMGVAIIFGLLNIVNFVHGAMYMMGAFIAWILLERYGIGYWQALIISPLVVGIVGILIERLLLRKIYKLDHMYGLLLMLGLTLIIEGLFRQQFGNAGQPYAIPQSLTGGRNLGFMFLPNYRAWVIAASISVCLATWLIIEKSKLGAYLRAATENPMLTRTFGVNVPRMIMLTYGFGAALAAFSGVMAAPIYQVSPMMGVNTVIIVFAVVVIGGLGSIVGAIVTGFGLGIIEGITKVIYPESSSVVVFIVMVIVLWLRPAGLFGKTITSVAPPGAGAGEKRRDRSLAWIGGIFLLVLVAILPFTGMYLGFAMKALCFALFACGFNLLMGYTGLLSFGHAAFFGTGAYVVGYVTKEWGVTPEVGLIFATIAAAGLGVIFGWLAIRRQGIYFAMITLALSQMMYFIYLQSPFTGGEDGLRDIPRGSLFGFIDLNSTINMYYFVLAVFLIGFFIIVRTIHSPFGQVLKAIRENEPRAISLGYNTSKCKLIAFVISAAIAGLAGGANTLVFQIAALTDVHWLISSDVLLMTLVGGVATILGPVVGAFLLVGLSGYLAPLGSWVTVIQGAIFVVCVLAFRRGIIGAILDVMDKFMDRSSHKIAKSPESAAVTTRKKFST